MAKNQTAKARVLSDHPSLGLKCGQIVEGQDAAIKALVAGGVADSHPDAVAYAAEQGEAVVSLAEG